MTAKTIREPQKKDNEVPHAAGLILGTTLGGISGALAAGALEGATVGAIVGIPGIISGIAIGGVLGAMVGKKTAMAFNPTDEDKYWRDNHENRAYFNSLVAYDAYAPAYRFGIEAYQTYVGRNFEEIESQLAKGWDKARGNSRLEWETARLAAKDAYQRLCNKN